VLPHLSQRVRKIRRKEKNPQKEDKECSNFREENLRKKALAKYRLKTDKQMADGL